MSWGHKHTSVIIATTYAPPVPSSDLSDVLKVEGAIEDYDYDGISRLLQGTTTIFLVCSGCGKGLTLELPGKEVEPPFRVKLEGT